MRLTQRSQRMPLVQLTAICGLLAVTAGCSPSGPETVVVGTVTYLAEPVAEGIVCFVPADGVQGPSMRVAITNGHYKADVSGGLLPGSYRVEIIGYRKVQDKNDGEATANAAGFPLQQYIPEKYNVKTQLKLTVEQSRRPVVCDFVLAE